MSGFVFFAIIVFVIIPMIKNAAKTKPTKKSANRSRSGQKNWTQVQKLLQEQLKEQNKNTNFGKRDAHGHTAARKNIHQRLHSGDGDTEVFPESHLARVRKRDQRDRSERNRIEAMLHSKKNTSITRESNKSVDSWGERGEESGGGGLILLILFGLIAFFIISKITPSLWPEIMQALNIR